ncbi:MAG: DEAD/DEAH box helicase, partial [Candidatus Limnocylindrus sp.]
MSGSRVALGALLARLHASPQLNELQERLRRDHAASLIHVPHAAKAALGAALARDTRIVWITRNPEVAERVADSLRAWSTEPDRITLLEPRSSLPYERGELVVDESAGRVAALAAWGSGESRILVTSLLAALQNSADPSAIAEASLPLITGTRMSLDEATERVATLGYERVPLVGGRGEYARRGGILDCFPAGALAPIRVEWFGDEIESIRSIDPATQRSGEPLTRALLLPASEFPLTPEVVAQARRAAEALARRDGTELSPTLLADLARWEAAPNPERGDGLEIWSPLIAPSRPLDQFAEALVILDEPSELVSSAESLARQSAERFDVLKTTRILPASWPAPIPPPAVSLNTLGGLGARRLELTWSSEAGRLSSSEASDAFGWHDPLMPAGRTRELAEGIESWQRDGARVLIVSEQAGRLSELLAEAGAATPVSDAITSDPKPKSITLLHGGLDGGFQGGVDGLTLITDRELFGATRVRRAAVHRRGITREAAERLTPGDLLVHVDHGLGRFLRMIRRGGEGDARDYLEIEYGGGDRVFVPTEQLARIARYTGAEDPSLSRLGGGEWRRAKERAKRAADELADELLRIYAARELAHRPPIQGDSPWLVEFEAAFPFRETPDQRTAIEAVKGDLAKGRPMDRVIVGDVGYGKTEVALRAAFAALEAGRQVALLVPTTILALQHAETFRRRLAAYPFRLELLSRSISSAKQAEVVAGLNDGSVDLVVATHRLLSNDVVFNRLGLLIVDEEHRFGVAAKERLKSIRAELDVMTLTATPIPRT